VLQTPISEINDFGSMPKGIEEKHLPPLKLGRQSSKWRVRSEHWKMIEGLPL
jgi:hypothetical protein